MELDSVMSNVRYPFSSIIMGDAQKVFARSDFSLNYIFSRRLTGTRINGRVIECISTYYSLPVEVLQWLPRFCSPLGMPQKSETKLNWHIIPFCTIWYNNGHPNMYVPKGTIYDSQSPCRAVAIKRLE